MATLYSGVYGHRDRIIEVVLFILNNSKLKYNSLFFVLKVLYYADMLHLGRYGRFICNSVYIHKEHGAYPQKVKKIIKASDQIVVEVIKEHACNNIKDCVKYLVPARTPDTDKLSISEQECLTEALQECYVKNVNTIKSETSYSGVRLDQIIPIEILLSKLDNCEDVLEYLDRY